MALVEKIDKHSGAILFKKDKESLSLEKAIKQIDELQKTITSLEKRVKKLEKTIESLK